LIKDRTNIEMHKMYDYPVQTLPTVWFNCTSSNC